MRDLRDAGYGCRIGDTVTNSFCYADDLVILAPTVTGISKLINICENYSQIYNINFKPSKCMLLHFNKSRLEMNIKLKMNGIDIPVGN